MALTELEACGLNVTTTRDGQPIVFDRDASDVDMMTLMHSLFPEAHEYVDDLIAREPLERDRNKHALIPAFRKRSTVQMLDAKTKYNARYVYESFPVGHKRNGLLIGGEIRLLIVITSCQLPCLHSLRSSHSAGAVE